MTAEQGVMNENIENVLKPLAIICQSDPDLFLLNHALVVGVVAGYRCDHSPSPVTAD